MNIHTYGVDGRLEFCREYLLDKNIQLFGNITLLPIPTTRDFKTVLGTSDTLEDVYEKLGYNDILVGYELPKSFRELLCQKHITVIDVSRDEEYLCDNAALTAMGTIGRILTEEKSAPNDLKIGVIGYGRIGKKLVQQLLFLGSGVTVFTSRSELSVEMCMLGITGVHSLSLNTDDAKAKLSSLDILINTAPAKLIPDEALCDISSIRLIELASGNNFPTGIYFERFASVPSAMYPKSAGIALGNSILRMLGEEKMPKQ